MGCEQSTEKRPPLHFGEDGGSNNAATNRNGSAAGGGRRKHKKPRIIFALNEAVYRRSGVDSLLPYGTAASTSFEQSAEGADAVSETQLLKQYATGPVGSNGGTANSVSPLLFRAAHLSNIVFNLGGPTIAAFGYPRPQPSDIIVGPCFDARKLRKHLAAIAATTNRDDNDNDGSPASNNNNDDSTTDAAAVAAAMMDSNSVTSPNPGPSQQQRSNGMLYRMVTTDGSGKWALYNDSQFYEFSVVVTFLGPVEALGATAKTENPDGTCTLSATIYPGCTELFASGQFEGFQATFSGRLVSPQYGKALAMESDDAVEGEMAAVVVAASSRDGFGESDEGKAVLSGGDLSKLSGKQRNTISEEILQACFGITPVGAASPEEAASPASPEEAPTPFVDLTFPPTQRSVQRGGSGNGSSPVSPSQQQQLPIPHVSWKRPKQFLFPNAGGDDVDFAAFGSNTTAPYKASVDQKPAAAEEGDASGKAAASGEGNVTSPNGLPTSECAVVSNASSTFAKISCPIDPNLIERGMLGDGWLVSAIAAVSENASRIHRILQHPISEDTASHEEVIGAYRVNLNLNGWWESIVIDDYIPTIGNWPCFIHLRKPLVPFVSLESAIVMASVSSSRGGANAAGAANPICVELWASFIEKAFAKTFGSYGNLSNAGDALTAMSEMMGCPYLRFDSEWRVLKAGLVASGETAVSAIDNSNNATSLSQAIRNSEIRDRSDRFFERLVSLDNAGYVTVLTTPSCEEPVSDDNDTTTVPPNRALFGALPQMIEAYRCAGLLLGHAYTLMDVREYPEYDLQICRIRNPFIDFSNHKNSATASDGLTSAGAVWRGDWSDDSPLWSVYSTVAADCCRNTHEPDGSFWMCFADVKKYFDGGGVCFTKTAKSHDYRVKGEFDGCHPSVSLELFVYEATEIHFTLSQRDRKRLQETKGIKGLAYAPAMLSLCEPLVGTGDGALGEGEQPVEIGPNELRYGATLNSNQHGMEPSSQITFAVARDVAMKVKLYPRSRPYLLVPRIYTGDRAKANGDDADADAARNGGRGGRGASQPRGRGGRVIPPPPSTAQQQQLDARVTPYVIGMLSDRPAGRTDDPSCAFSVKFRRLDGAMPIFGDKVGAQFGYDDICTPVVHAEYQYVDPMADHFNVVDNFATSIPAVV